MTPHDPDDGDELQLQLDIPLSLAPRASHNPAARAAPHALLARAQARLVFVSTVFFGLFLIVALRLFDATMLTETPSRVAVEGDTETGQIVRANMTDRYGELLATSLPTKSLYADPKRVLDPDAAAHALVGVFPDLNYKEILEKLTSARRFVWIRRNLTPDEIYRVNALGQPGLEFQAEHVRIYPAGGATVHVVGTTDVDGHGLSGVERGLEARMMQGGDPVALSLDLRLQHIVEREVQDATRMFRAVGGTGIVMDIRSGEILAAVSLPTYAPTAMSEAGEEARFNRFSLGTYELGSVMKVLNTAAALESGKVHLWDVFDTTHPITFGRFTINDYHPVQKRLSVPEIFLYSSNIGSARMALQFGPAFQHAFLCRLGVCDALKTEIPEVGVPQIPRDWKEINAMTIAFGHGVAISPLQFVRAAAATLNGGHLVTPTFLRRDSVSAPVGPTVVSARTVDAMRRIMRANVTEAEGSGKKAEVPGYFVGGKTGTAEKTQGRRYSQDARLSSFLAAFPMQDPRYIVFVMIDEPHPTAETYGFATGGWVAAPVAGHIIAQMGPLLGMAPFSLDDPEIAKALELDISGRGVMP